MQRLVSYVDDGLADRLLGVAKAERRSASATVALLIEEALDRRAGVGAATADGGKGKGGAENPPAAPPDSS